MTPESLFLKYDQSIAELGFQLRDYLLETLKDIIEVPDEPANMIAYTYGKGYKDMICTIMASKKGIKLGFYRGTELPDPHKLLTGTGKVHQYVEIKSVGDIHNPALKALLDEALKSYELRIASQGKK